MLLGQCPELPFALGGACRQSHVKYPGQHPADIAIQGGFVLTESHRGNGSGGIATHARQKRQIGSGAGHLPTSFPDLSGGAPQIARPAVIAQTFPERQNLLFAGGSQRFQGGEARHPALKIGADRVHLGLLQHDLRDPDRIRVWMAAPGQSPGVHGVPGQQFFGQFSAQSSLKLKPVAGVDQLG